MDNKYTDVQLISLVKSGSDKALKELLSRYGQTVSYYVQKYSEYCSDKEELLQEAYIALWVATQVYNEDLSKFSTFASVCIQRAMIKSLRKDMRKGNIPQNMLSSLEEISLPSTDNPEYVFIEDENFRNLFDKIKSALSKLEFKVLFLYISNGSYKETADELGISEKSVSNSLSRARSKIMQLTGNC